MRQRVVQDRPSQSSLARRLSIAGVCVGSVIVCLWLAWWQWERYSSAGGTFQNLGYVLQWPLFGLFPAFMFWRMRKLKRQAELADAAAANDDDAANDNVAVTEPAAASPRNAAAHGTAVVDDADPEDAELAAYNRYLAELHARSASPHD
ncbi:MAG: hypothetical protein GEU86_18635 [Actinophytocola sp.]|nr:hypothetical protein [Actinophytocola sp.]